MRSLQTVLEDDYGVALTGWRLTVATAVSADGSVVAGLGTSPNGPEGWRADLRSAVWLDASYVQAAGGTLAVELGQPGYDRLAVTGAATLDLLPVGGHVFAVGDTYTVLTAGSLAGTFETIIEPPSVDVAVRYGATEVEVEVTAVSTASAPETDLSSVFALHPAYPNPAGGRVKVGYDMAGAGRVRLAVYDALGREVVVLVDGERPAGGHEVVLDAGGLASASTSCG